MTGGKPVEESQRTGRTVIRLVGMISKVRRRRELAPPLIHDGGFVRRDGEQIHA